MFIFYLFMAHLYSLHCPVRYVFMIITNFENHSALIIRYLFLISTHLIINNLFDEILYVVRHYSHMLRLFTPKMYLKLTIYGYSREFFTCSNIYMFIKSTFFKKLTYLCIIDFLNLIFTNR